MKKIALIFLLFLIGLSSCKKDPNPADILRNKMIGLWSYVKISTQEFDANGVPTNSTVTQQQNSSLEFKGSGKESTIIDNFPYMEISWNAINGNSFHLGDFDYTVQTIDDHNFVFKTEYVDLNNQKTINTYTLSR